MFEFLQPVAESIGLSLNTTLIISGVLTMLITLLIVNQVVAAMSDKKRAPTYTTLAAQAEKKRKRVRDRFLVAGPDFAGKTQLYYKLIGGSISDTVSSSDINETNDVVQVKVPARLLSADERESTPTEDGAEDTPASAYRSIEAKFVDVPGHFNFRKTIQVESTGAKAIILLLDAKEKAKFGEAAEILYDLLGDVDTIE